MSKVVVVLLIFTCGCAIVYRDEQSGAVHLWGIGHMAMRTTPEKEGKKAVIRGVSVCGLSAGLWDHSAFFTVGWDRQQVVEVLDENTAFQIEGPSADFMEISVGGISAVTQQSEDE